MPEPRRREHSAFNCRPSRPISWFCDFHSHVAVAASPLPFPLISCQIPFTLHTFTVRGFDKAAHVSHAPGPASVGWGHRAQRLRHWTAGSPRSRRPSRPAHSAEDGGGRRRFGGVASTSVAVPCFSGLGSGFCGTTVTLILARSPSCPSRHEPGRSHWQGFPIPAESVQTCFPTNQHV